MMSPRIWLPLANVVATLIFPSSGFGEEFKLSNKLSASGDLAAATVVKAYSRTYGITGGAVAVLYGDEVIYEQTFGHASIEFGVPVNADTRFQLSSTTKIFTATLMSVLAAEGLVDYDKAVRHYLPDMPESWSDVLVVDVLSHLSGLPEVLECGEDLDREAALECVYMLKRPAERRAEFRYNQTNYLLALRVVEAVTEESFAEALDRKVLTPAGMSSAELNGNYRDVLSLRAINYYPDGDGGITLREYSFPEYLMSAAGLNVSLTDMIAYASALNGNHLLDASGKARMWTVPVFADGSPSGYAQGWELDDMRDSLLSVGHEGGYLTTFRVYPEYDLSVVALTSGIHCYFSLDEFADVLAQSFAPDILVSLDSLAYRAKLSYMTGGLAGAIDLLNVDARTRKFSNDEVGEIVAWLAGEMTDIGDVDGAAMLVTWYERQTD